MLADDRDGLADEREPLGVGLGRAGRVPLEHDESGLVGRALRDGGEHLADAYRAVYQKVGEGEAYTMNHSLTIYLMGPDGRMRSALGHDLGPANAARIIEQAMARG